MIDLHQRFPRFPARCSQPQRTQRAQGRRRTIFAAHLSSLRDSGDSVDSKPRTRVRGYHLLSLRDSEHSTSREATTGISLGRKSQDHHPTMFHSRNATTGAFDLTINRYKEVVHEQVQHDSPNVILGRLKKLEDEIASDLEELDAMLG